MCDGDNSFCFATGLRDQEILRQEMIAQLCMGDKTHSQLVDLISFLTVHKCYRMNSIKLCCPLV